MLTQPPSATTSLRQIPKLSCTLSSGETGYTVDWNQQSPEKGPWFVMHVGTNSIVGDMGAGIPDCFSGSGSGLDHPEHPGRGLECLPLWSRPWQWEQLRVTRSDTGRREVRQKHPSWSALCSLRSPNLTLSNRDVPDLIWDFLTSQLCGT
jgi:hypothetical protein